MSSRTLLSFDRVNGFIMLQTISKLYGKSMRFYIENSALESILDGSKRDVTLKDIRSYMDIIASPTQIRFSITWLLSDDGEKVNGHIENLDIDIKAFGNWYHSTLLGYKALNQVHIPGHIIMSSYRNLKAVLADRFIKRQFSKVMRQIADWSGITKIQDDFCANSFYFVKCNSQSNREYNGGIIWHNDVKQYSIHT
jgi:hypothetical protein